jgi:feruloyl esterase
MVPPAATSPYAALPAFCRVAVTLRPGPKSDVKAEVWMPASGWNGKLQVVGNGGFAGTIGYRALATALANGYAAASTDTGHSGPAANTFATDDATLDFAYRAIHETAVAAKRAVDGFYGAAPKFSYFNGCSTGGRQALTAAQRYPDDFTGIVGGAPAIYTTKQAFGQLWFYQAIAVGEGAIPKEKLPLIHDAVLAACDALDGATDGVLENPLACRFDPGVLACKPGAAASSCLTAPQVESVRRIYAGASHAVTGEKIFPGLERGSELGWSPVPVSYAVDYFKHIVFKNASWDPAALNFGGDVAEAYPAAHQIFDANDPRLGAFTSRGGKLLMYQGWAEPGIPPGHVVNYYAAVKRTPRTPPAPCGSSWCRAWATAAAATARAPSTWWRRSIGGSKRARRPSRFQRRACAAARSIARGRSAPIRAMRATRAPAAWTTPRTSADVACVEAVEGA